MGVPRLHLTTLLRRLGLQTNLYCSDSGSKRISTAQTRAPNESLLLRLGLQTNLYCSDSGSKRISTAQTRAPNESLLLRLGLQTNLYCSDSGSKRISTAQTQAPKWRNLLKMATTILRWIPRFFLGQKTSSVVADGHAICKPNTVITKINAKKPFVILIIFIHERKSHCLGI